MSLSAEIREELLKNGASIVGFGDLKEISYESRPGLDYGISIALALNPEIINNINEGVTHEYHDEYNRANSKLDQLAILGAEILKKHGYKAIPQTVSKVVIDRTDHRTQLPHKTVATRSGIGWIGKCALLVTKDFGSAVRLTSVATDAALDTGEPINEARCGDCDRCVVNCPAKVVKGVNWDIEKKREDYYNAIDCRKEARRRSGLAGIDQSLCGLCILSCPYTQKYIESKNIIYRGKNIK